MEGSQRLAAVASARGEALGEALTGASCRRSRAGRRLQVLKLLLLPGSSCSLRWANCSSSSWMVGERVKWGVGSVKGWWSIEKGEGFKWRRRSSDQVVLRHGGLVVQCLHTATQQVELSE